MNNFPTAIKLGIVVNADDIEKEFTQNGQLNLTHFDIKFNKKALLSHLKRGICSTKNILFTNSDLTISQSSLIINTALINSYVAADIAEYIRIRLLEKQISFSFETVFSHPSKIEFIKMAKVKGYRIYLYFIATESPEINISRVENRVAKSGHYVEPQLIISRYHRTLENLYENVKLTNRA